MSQPLLQITVDLQGTKGPLRFHHHHKFSECPYSRDPLGAPDMGHHTLRKGKETSNIVRPDLELNLSWKAIISNCYRKEDFMSASKRQDSLHKHIALAASSQYAHCILHLSSMNCPGKRRKSSGILWVPSLRHRKPEL